MTTIELFGQVNDQGELEIEKPQGLHVGKKVKVTITELDETPQEGHWGKNFVALLDQLDLSDWESDDISDPVEWVKHQRQEQAKRRGLNWGDE
jgi:hypothetical protein